MHTVRIIRKLASIINGIDLSAFHVGDIIRVPESTAAMLVREGWAEPVGGDTPPDPK